MTCFSNSSCSIFIIAISIRLQIYKNKLILATISTKSFPYFYNLVKISTLETSYFDNLVKISKKSKIEQPYFHHQTKTCSALFS